jgi:integrase
MHWTGCRISDAVELGSSMVDNDGWLVFYQAKTGGQVAVPLYRDPPAFVDPTDLDHLHRAIEQLEHRREAGTWLATAAGVRRSEKAASSWFAASARAAGVQGKTAHGLRVRRAILQAEGGASLHQIGAWTGHESLKEIEHYSRQADRRRLLSTAT